MIIPIRCMNCGMVLADKWIYYKEEVKRLRGADGKDVSSIYMDGKSVPQTAELQVLERL
jgi:DNA-directed RNA polymerase subunit N (RpoN/RPB10)